MKDRWAEAADAACEILTAADAHRPDLEREAERRGITIPQLLAAAITERIRSIVERTVA